MPENLHKESNAVDQPGERERAAIEKARDYGVAPDPNRDPLTDAPGSHPVGVGVGAAAAGATGAVIGSVAGPVGTAVGAVIGAVAGGLAGKGVAEAVNPTLEEAYWRDEYLNRPYYTSGLNYDEYAPAYRYGWEARTRFAGRRWDEIETELGRGWDQYRGRSTLDWEQARHPARDAWERIEARPAPRPKGE